MSHLPIQELLQEEYLRITPLHRHLSSLSEIPHRHDHYEFILCTKGAGNQWIDFKPFALVPNRLFFVRKGQVHLIEDFEREGWLLMFGEELFNRFLKIHPKQSQDGVLNAFTPHPFIDLDEDLQALFLQLVNQCQRELDREKPDPDLLLHLVSLWILQTNRTQIVQHPKSQSVQGDRGIFQKLKILIEELFKQQHLAAHYADELNMDIKKLNRICREATGNTLFDLIQERILTEAKIELKTSSDSIKEISYLLGFGDPAFFGRFFKRHTGITPAEFRKKQIA